MNNKILQEIPVDQISGNPHNPGLFCDTTPRFQTFNSKKQCDKIKDELPCPSGQGMN